MCPPAGWLDHSIRGGGSCDAQICRRCCWGPMAIPACFPVRAKPCSDSPSCLNIEKMGTERQKETSKKHGNIFFLIILDPFANYPVEKNLAEKQSPNMALWLYNVNIYIHGTNRLEMWLNPLETHYSFYFLLGDVMWHYTALGVWGVLCTYAFSHWFLSCYFDCTLFSQKNHHKPFGMVRLLMGAKDFSL